MLSCLAHAQDAAGVRLVHRFVLAEGGEWRAVAIDLASADWRVGSEDGPRATDAQRRAALGAVDRIEIRARCCSWTDGPTRYPCGFAMRALEWGGRTIAAHTILGADLEAGPRRAAGETRMALPESPAADAPHFDPPHAVTLRVGGLPAIDGGQLRFEFRAVSNSIVPSRFEAASGAVTLHIGKRGIPS